MLSIDDRAGNAVTTVALFLIVTAILYLARSACQRMLSKSFGPT